MIKRLIAVAAVLSVMSLYGCSKDCKVCVEYEGIKDCQTVEDVKKSDCEDCSSIGEFDAAFLELMGGAKMTCEVQ